MLRSLRILLLSSLALAPAAAMAATPETDAEKAAAAKALTAATEACDKGAAAPLDPAAKAAPVQFSEMIPFDLKMSKVEALQSACQRAWAGAPKEERLQLQWLRATVALGKPGQEWLLVPQVKMLADAGSAEAQYLMFRLFTPHRSGDDAAAPPLVTKEEALAYLRKAVEQGHITALMELMTQYHAGPLLRPDNHEAVRMARRIESAPPQGKVETPYERETRNEMALTIALITLEDDSFPKPEQRIAFGIVEKDSEAGTNTNYSALTYIKALRFGRGTGKDPVRARQLLEAGVTKDKRGVPMLADMLARGEGGPADGKRAIALLRDKDIAYVDGAATVLAGLLLDGKFVGAQPQEAIRVLSQSWNLADQIRLAGLLIDYHTQLEIPKRLVEPLTDAAIAGDPKAALALARLKLSDNSQFTDVEGARAILKPFADAGNREALWLYASSQYANLDSSSYQPYRQPDGLSDENLRKLIDEGMAKKEPQAFLLRAQLLRKGVLYPQDDQAATAMLISAANLGNVRAMVLLGNAYDDGLGTPKNPRERLHAWREAAKRGSLAAKQNLANAFIFDTFGKLMTLDEGVTTPLVLYINSVDRAGIGLSIDDTMAEVRLGTIFSFGSRAMEAGVPAVAEAAMNAFREAPAGLEEKTLVMLGKAFPDEIRVAIERKLKSEGFYSGETSGYFGPDVRKALAAWVDARGPLAETAADEAKPDTQPKAKKDGLVDPDMLARVRDRAFKDGTAAKTDRQKLTAISALNTLAQYGDMAPRWALVRNYHQARVVRKIVSPAEITRYALDVMVTKPEGVEKAEFEFIFNTTQIYQDGQIRAFGGAVLAAIRDDPRLQDPLTLGGIMQQFVFAPGACDAILDTAKKARIKDLGQDGCDTATMTALIDFAKARGPAGIDAAARKAATVDINAMDEEAAR
jgi:TPR repeat protein